jgi:hypothetical protein
MNDNSEVFVVMTSQRLHSLLSYFADKFIFCIKVSVCKSGGLIVAESLAEEQRVSQELLLHTEKRCDEKLSQQEVELALVRSKYQNQVRLLEQEKEEAERSLIELRSLLNRERARWQEDLSAVQQQAKAREV